MLHWNRILASLLAMLLLASAWTSVAEEPELAVEEEPELAVEEAAAPLYLEPEFDESLGDLELELVPQVGDNLGEMPELPNPDGSAEENGDILLQANASDSDFEIVDGVLTKYRGAGGNVVIPSSVTCIGEWAFDACTSLTIPLTSITIPDSVTSIEGYAFYDCESLTSVTIPNSVTHIGQQAFFLCANLASISIPNSVTSIEHSAFSYCSSLTSVTIPNSITSIKYSSFLACTSLASITIPNSVTSIEDSAYSYCSSLISVTIPNSVTKIGYETFSHCTNLKSVTIPNSVTSIAYNAFAECPNLTIYCYSGSLAEEYAKKYSIPYVIIGAVVKSISIDQGDSATVYAGAKLFLKVTIDPSGAKPTLTWSSSDASVAAVNKQGVVTAKKQGSAVITVTADNCKSDSIKITVPKPPKKVTLDKKKATLFIGKKLTLHATLSPSDSQTKLSWSSSDKEVAKVSASKGVVTALKEGTATITVTTSNGKTAKCNITVPPLPKSIAFAKKAYEVKKGKTLTLKVKMKPDNAQSDLKWYSSNRKVATVDGNGKVKGIKGGKVTITVLTSNGKQATCELTVKDETIYRALLIGEVNFPGDTCKRNEGDVDLMEKILSARKGPAGGSYTITRKTDLSAKSVLNSIKTAFAEADDNDVSLFFIATHGDTKSSGSGAGALSMTSGSNLQLKDLANALNKIPGEIIVILESCGSGAAVYANGKELYSQMEDAAKAFDASAVRAFSEIDPGLCVDSEGYVVGNGRIASNTGEFRIINKFYVLTASRYQELSWGNEVSRHNYFTKWLTDGIGTSGKMKADANNNGTTSLRELYNYIAKVGNNKKNWDAGKAYYQHVQVYPSNSTYGLFKK